MHAQKTHHKNSDKTSIGFRTFSEQVLTTQERHQQDHTKILLAASFNSVSLEFWQYKSGWFIKACIPVHIIDTICLSVTCLD